MNTPTTPSGSGHHAGDQPPGTYPQPTSSQSSSSQPADPSTTVPAPTPAPVPRHPRTGQRNTVRAAGEHHHRAGAQHRATARASNRPSHRSATRSGPGSDSARPQPDSALTGAPDPEGDVVPGHPPVPITVWYLPKPRRGIRVHPGLVRRLIANYTHPGTGVINLIAGHRLGTRNRPPAALIITSWPQSQTSPDHRPDEHVAACAEHLDEGGCLVVVVANHTIPDALGILVGAARTAGLRYLQHVVVAHHLTPRANPPTAQATERCGPPAPGQAPQLRVHTDLLVFRLT